MWMPGLVFWMSGIVFGMSGLVFGCPNLVCGCLDLYFGCLDSHRVSALSIKTYYCLNLACNKCCNWNLWIAVIDKHIAVLIRHAINAVSVYFLVDILVKVL